MDPHCRKSPKQDKRRQTKPSRVPDLPRLPLGTHHQANVGAGQGEPGPRRLYLTGPRGCLCVHGFLVGWSLLCPASARQHPCKSPCTSVFLTHQPTSGPLPALRPDCACLWNWTARPPCCSRLSPLQPSFKSQPCWEGLGPSSTDTNFEKMTTAHGFMLQRDKKSGASGARQGRYDHICPKLIVELEGSTCKHRHRGQPSSSRE